MFWMIIESTKKINLAIMKSINATNQTLDSFAYWLWNCYLISF